MKDEQKLAKMKYRESEELKLMSQADEESYRLR